MLLTRPAILALFPYFSTYFLLLGGGNAPTMSNLPVGLFRLVEDSLVEDMMLIREELFGGGHYSWIDEFVLSRFC